MVYSGSGSGTSADPYIIITADQLNEIRDYPDAYWELGNDIDLNVSPYNTGTGWVPIPLFSGNLNGKGYTIDNLYINNPTTDEMSFIKLIEWADIRNLTFTNVDITAKNFAAGLAVDINYSFVVNCSVSGDISGENYVAGLFTYGWESAINKCYTNMSLTASDAIGGFCINSDGKTLNCYSISTCSGRSYVSGFALKGVFENCYSAGSVTGTGSFIGGFSIGSGDGIFNYWDITTSGTNWSTKAIGKTTAEMKKKDTFENWSFGNIWTIEEGVTYPTLLWQPFTIETLEVLSSPLDISTSIAKIRGRFSDYDIDPTITESGFVWGRISLENPVDVAPSESDYDNYDTGGGTSSFWTKTLSSLPEGQTYFYRAYAKNTDGVYCYGDELSFTTLTEDSSIVYENDITDEFGSTVPAIKIIFN